MKTLCLMFLCMGLAAAVQAQTSKKSNPKAKTQGLLRTVYKGDIARLKIVQGAGGATLYSDHGLGMRSSPRHYYLTFKTAEKYSDVPRLVFVEPPNDEYLGFPQVPVYLASKPGAVWPSKIKVHSPQLWVYPALPKSKGLFALVSGFDESGNPTEAAPILWWGLSRGQDLETISRVERTAVYAELGK